MNHGVSIPNCFIKNVLSVSLAAAERIFRASSCQNHLRLMAKNLRNSEGMVKKI